MKRKQSIEPDLYVINKKPSEKELEEFYEFIEIASRYKKTTKSKYNNEIDAAVKRVREGKSVSNDEVMKEMDNL
jgi:hypothetical protein